MQLATTARNALGDALRAAFDAGAGAAILAVYSGAMPANAAAALAANTLLAKLVLSDPSAPATVGGVLTLSPVNQDNQADAGGVASFFRIYSSADGVTIADPANCVAQGTITDTAGNGDLKFITTTIVLNQPVLVSSWSFTMPGQ